MKILITGSHGQLGTELLRQLKEGRSEIGPIPEKLCTAKVIPTDADELDITDRDEVVAFVRRMEPDVIINCAAYTNVDGCESHTEDAFKVNALGPRNLAIAAQKVGAKLVHVSTDYVFSGKENGGVPLDESALPAPVSAYGRTKLLGEQYVRQFCPRSFVVRTAWLYSHTGKNFVFTMVNDQLGNPTNAADLAHHLLKLAVSSEYGTYHCTGEGVCSWYDFACEIIRLSGVKATVAPCTSAEYAAAHPDAASRPAWSALENRMLACTVGNEMRPWQEALTEFFKNESPEA